MICVKNVDIMKYISPEISMKVCEFVNRINERLDDGEYEIIGRDVFARVQTYSTIMPESCKIEAHNIYVDIQGTICGAEGISVYDRGCLQETGGYQKEKDVCFYDGNDKMPLAHVNNLPGYATILFPMDAHRPKELIGDIKQVKKFVIKVKTKYVNSI